MTTLAQQLSTISSGGNKRIAAAATKPSNKRPSLLFNQQQASDIDIHALYILGCEGLEALCRLEPRFHGFRTNLFSQASVDFVREQQTFDTLQVLNETLVSFFDSLAEHFLSPGCFKCLEYLIRKYHINEHNVHSLISMALPYHSTNEFVCLVQTLHLSNQGIHPINNCWGWLSRMQESGASLSRHVLVERCLLDRAVLRALCEGAKRLGQRKGVEGHIYLSFYAVSLCELIASLDSVDEELIEYLLPFIMEGLQDTSCTDYRACTLMIFAELCTRASLSQTILSAILTSTVLNMEEGSHEHLRSVLLVLSHVAKTQAHLHMIPYSALQRLMDSPLLIGELILISKLRTHMNPFLRLLCKGLLELAVMSDHASESLSSFQSLQIILSEGLIEGFLAEQLTLFIFEIAPKALSDAKDSNEHVRSWLMKCLQTIERGAPESVDSAVNNFLGAGALPERGQRSSSDDEYTGADNEEIASNAAHVRDSSPSYIFVYKMIIEAFAGTSHAPCGESGMTVEAASKAPQAGLRKAAMIHAGQMLKAGTEVMHVEDRSRLGNCLLSGLGDDAWSVVHAALEVVSLSSLSVPSSAVLSVLSSVLKRAGKALLMPKSVDSQEASGSVMAIHYLVKVFAFLQDTSFRHETVAEARNMALLLVLSLGLAPIHAVDTVFYVMKYLGELFPEDSSLASALRRMPELLDNQHLVKPFPSNLPKSGKKALRERNKEEKIALLVHFRRCLVDAVASSIVSSRALADILYLAELGADETQTMPRSSLGTAALHIIILGLHTSLINPNFSFAFSQSKTHESKEAKKSYGKSKQPTSAEDEPNEPNETATLPLHLASGLIHLCLSDIKVLCHSLGNESHLFDEWSEQGELFFGSSSISNQLGPLRPTEEHIQQSHSSLSKIHSAALCCALHSALVKESKEQRSQPRDIAIRTVHERFCQVSLIPHSSSFHIHLHSLLDNSFTDLIPRCSFLCQLYASPTVSPQARVSALILHLDILESSNSMSLLKCDAISSWFGYILSAACDADANVRERAASLLFAVGSLKASAVSSEMAATCAALAAQHQFLSSDSNALLAIINQSLYPSHSAAVPIKINSAPTMVKANKGGAKGHTELTPLVSAGPSLLSFPSPEAIKLLLVSSLPHLLPCQPMSLADLNALRILLICFVGGGASSFQSFPPELTSLCLDFVASLFILPALESGSSGNDLVDPAHVYQIAHLLVNVISSACVSSTRPDPYVLILCQLVAPDDVKSTCTSPYHMPLRHAAFKSVSEDPLLLNCLMTCSSAAPSFLVSLIVGSTSDSSPQCQKYAHNALEAVNLDGCLLEPLILSGMHQKEVHASMRRDSLITSPPMKRKKMQANDDPSEFIPELPSVISRGDSGVAGLNLSIHVLELLTWKHVTIGLPSVISAIQALLKSLLPQIGSMSAPHLDDAIDSVNISSLVGYAAQLALSAIESASLDAMKAGDNSLRVDLIKVIQPELAVKAAQNAPDNAVRNSALSLVSVLSCLMPEAVLGHVLEVLSVIQRTVVVQEDMHSMQVATLAMTALVPAWLKAGCQSKDMWQIIVDALPRVTPSRRLSLLSSLLAAMPEDAGLPIGLVLLIEQATLAPASASSQELPIECSCDWWLSLAVQLASQVETTLRIQSFSLLLAKSMELSNGRAHTPLVRMSVAFVTHQLLKVKAHIGSVGLPSQSISSQLQLSCEQLMNQALVQVQVLTQPMDQILQLELDEQKGSQKDAGMKKKLLQRACKSSLESLYLLLKALQTLMTSDSYLRALASLADSPSEKLQVRVLKLFADKVRQLQGELESLTDLPAQEQKTQEDRLSLASLLPCSMLAKSLGGTVSVGSSGLYLSSPLVIQALLVAAGEAMSSFGRLRPDAVMSALPCILKLAESPVNALSGNSSDLQQSLSAVRASALVAMASATRALGIRLVPLLPTAIQVTLQSGMKTVAKLDKKGHSEDDSVYVELTASLVSLLALIDSQGAFISPYLKDILFLLMEPRVLACTEEGCAIMAATARSTLTSVVPARLMLDPAFSSFSTCIAGGISSTLALLSLVQSTIEGMETKVAASSCESAFLFLLRVLDIRSFSPPSLSDNISVHLVEVAATRALMALVMKLTESRFKPLFLRMLEWATSSTLGYELGEDKPSGQTSDMTFTARPIMLFGVTSALVNRLRSVFVPYFRYLMDSIIRYLSLDAIASQPRKKQRKQQLASDPSPSSSTEDIIQGWVLRIHVLQALNLALLHDVGGFFDSDKMTRLLDPLVSQLTADAPPSHVLVAVEEQCGLLNYQDTQFKGPSKSSGKASSGASSFDLLGSKAVACLVQMAITANSDMLWKPLNHRVLMLTRNGNVRTRLLALEVVMSLAQRLREEYLVLLPETLPFLSELLEDLEEAVSMKAQQIVALLEDIGGEKLDSYLKRG